MMDDERIERLSPYRSDSYMAALRSLVSSGIRDTRVLNAVIGQGVTCLDDFSQKTADEILQWPGIAKKGLRLVVEVLASHGLSLYDPYGSDETMSALTADVDEARKMLKRAEMAYKTAINAREARRAIIAASHLT